MAWGIALPRDTVAVYKGANSYTYMCVIHEHEHGDHDHADDHDATSWLSHLRTLFCIFTVSHV